MPTISATNSGSGLDVRNLVDQLVAAEGNPISSRLDKKEVSIQEGLTAIGTFKGALIDFQSSLGPLRKEDAFKSINATSSNEEKFSVSASENAVTGSYDIEISQLAQSQKLKSQSFASEFDAVGAGSITFDFGEVNNVSNSFEVNGKAPSQTIEIAEESSSLRDIQETINEANIGVRASIINDGSGYRLIFNSEKSGSDHSLRISVADNDANDSDISGLSVLAYNPVASASVEGGDISGKNLEEIVSAKNAIFSIDGISISSGENEVENSIPGVTLNLKKITEDTVESFKIETETSGIKKSIETFVSSYNELMTSAITLTGYDPESGQAGPLSGDASIRGIISQIRRGLATSFNDINKNLTSLSSIGIDGNRDGTLALDSLKLDAALNDHADEIAHLFSAAVSVSDPKIRITSEKIPATDGIFNLIINQTPTSGSLTGKRLAYYPDGINEKGSIALMVDEVTTSELKFPPRSYSSGSEFATELQQVINKDQYLKRNGISVSVAYINNALKITSNSVGSKSNVTVRSISQNLADLTGLPVAKGEAGTDLMGKIDGYDLIGEGSKLKLQGSLSGIVLDVSGNKTGFRGDLTVTNGVASVLDKLTDSFLLDNGVLDSRIDGYNSRMKVIEKDREDLVRKLEISEQKYLKQFSNLDAMLGKMRATSDFLSEKLSSLPGAARR
jgi:flagellar hook-associated protein 2